jgi:hypothetical protein
MTKPSVTVPNDRMPVRSLPDIGRRPNVFFRHWRGPVGRRDDDDDPPPCPAAALPLGLELALRRKWEPQPDLMAA